MDHGPETTQHLDGGAEATAVRFIRIGAASAGVAVAAGAFGAHALRTRVEARALEVFETAARYQMYHALAILAVAVFLQRAADRAPGVRRAADPLSAVVVAGWCFVAGTVLFCGSLYALALTGVGILGAITPLGGVCFLLGWMGLVRAAAVTRR